MSTAALPGDAANTGRPGFPARSAVLASASNMDGPTLKTNAIQRGVQAVWPTGPAPLMSPQSHLQLAREDARKQAAGLVSGSSAGPGHNRHGAAPKERAVGVSAAVRPASRISASPQPASRAHTDTRGRMVDRLGQHDGIQDARVLAALRGVARHRFVDPALAGQAYEDTSLPIGHGQTISKPSVVARMIELLMQGEAARSLGGLGRTLEIGTGCGYQAAVLCRLASEVFSVERLMALHQLARTNLSEHRPRHLRLIYGDGMLGHPPNAPYTSILSAAGGAAVPEAWLDQLAVGGRLVAPVAFGPAGGQALRVVDRLSEGYRERTLEAVHFVPLKSGSS